MRCHGRESGVVSVAEVYIKSSIEVLPFTSSARLCGVRVVKPGRLSVCLFLSNKGCLFKTV